MVSLVSADIHNLPPRLNPPESQHPSTKREIPLQTGSSVHKNKSLVLQNAGQFTWDDRHISTSCTSRDILVRVIATGLCGSDIHFWQHGRIGDCVLTGPIVLGHESAGVVEACGPDVKGFAVGDRVALEPGISCTTCNTCRSGKYNLCESMRFAATPPYDGTLSTFYRLPQECCFNLPPNISFEEGALVEPLSVAVHCCKLAGIVPCSSLTVFGSGPIGLLCCAVARAFGASNIIVADIVESRLTFAREYVGAATYEIGREGREGPDGFSPELLLSKLGSPAGSDVVIDATGVESCIGYGIQALKRGGVFVQAGLGPSQINFPISLVCAKEAVFKGSYRYGPGDYKLAIDLLKTEKVKVKALITNRYDFPDAEQAFINASKHQGIKHIIYGPSVSRSGDDFKQKI